MFWLEVSFKPTALEWMSYEDLTNPKDLHSFLVVTSAHLGLQLSPTCSRLSEDLVAWLQRDWLNSAADIMSHLAQVTLESIKEQRDGTSPAYKAWTFVHVLMNTSLCSVADISWDMFASQHPMWSGRGPSPCLCLVTGRHQYASKRFG